MSASQPGGGTNRTFYDIDNFRYFAYTATYSVVFPVGLLSNGAALFVLMCLTPRKSPSTMFMINLAFSDVGFSLTLPFRLVYYFRGCQWDFPDWFCRWCVFSFYLNLYTSILFLTGLSVIRYVAVVHPIHNKSVVTMRRANLACFGIWVFVAFLSLPFLMSGTRESQGKLRCFEPDNMASWKRIYVLNYIGSLFGFVLPFITILGCYGCIIYKLSNRQDFGNRQSNVRKRSLVLIAVVLTTFLLCFLPYHVARTAHLHDKVSNHTCPVRLRIVVVSRCMAASNSCFNPLLYYFAGESFRMSFRRMSDRAIRSSFNHSVFFSSFRRHTLSDTLQRSRRENGKRHLASLCRSQNGHGKQQGLDPVEHDDLNTSVFLK